MDHRLQQDYPGLGESPPLPPSTTNTRRSNTSDESQHDRSASRSMDLDNIPAPQHPQPYRQSPAQSIFEQAAPQLYEDANSRHSTPLLVQQSSPMSEYKPPSSWIPRRQHHPQAQTAFADGDPSTGGNHHTERTSATLQRPPPPQIITPQSPLSASSSSTSAMMEAMSGDQQRAHYESLQANAYLYAQLRKTIMPTPQYDGVVGGSAGGYFSSGAPSGTTPPPQFFQSQVRPASTMHPYGGYFRSAGEYASAPHQSMPPPPTTLNAGMKRPAPPMNGNSGGDEASPSILMVPPPSGATPTADEGAPRTKRPTLVTTPPPMTMMPGAASSKYPYAASYPPPNQAPTGFGLGIGRYGHEIPSPLDAEIQHTILEMRQELAYIETLPENANLRHSKRLLRERCTKLEDMVDPDWVEVDISKPIKVTKRILIPIFRHPNYNYVGRILGPRGATLKNICKKFRCFVSVMGAGSTKDRNRELELLDSGDQRFSHYASPLHIRIDTVAPAHVAHMRLAAVLNVFHKIMVPGPEPYIEGITAEKPKYERKPRQQSNEFAHGNGEDLSGGGVDEGEEESVAYEYDFTFDEGDWAGSSGSSGIFMRPKRGGNGGSRGAGRGVGSRHEASYDGADASKKYPPNRNAMSTSPLSAASSLSATKSVSSGATISSRGGGSTAGVATRGARGRGGGFVPRTRPTSSTDAQP